MSWSNSGSDCDPRYGMVDGRKRKRMESNRESARRSRMRKQKQRDDLIGQSSKLKKDNERLVHRISDTTQRYMEVESNNNILRAQLVELTDRLQSLNSVLHIVEEVSGLTVDKPEIPDMIMKPWKLPYPMQQPVIASAEMLQG